MSMKKVYIDENNSLACLIDNPISIAYDKNDVDEAIANDMNCLCILCKNSSSKDQCSKCLDGSNWIWRGPIDGINCNKKEIYDNAEIIHILIVDNINELDTIILDEGTIIISQYPAKKYIYNKSSGFSEIR